MRFPRLKQIPARAESQSVFGGYRHAARVGQGEWYDMQNLTAAHFPTLSVRAPRGLYATPAAVSALGRYDTLLYTDGADLVVGAYRVPLSLDAEKTPKKITRMGAYVIVMPDKRYVNLADLSDFGAIEAHVTVRGAHLSPCRADGSAYTRVVVSPGAPAAPAEGESVAWIDTASSPHVLCEYSGAMAAWLPQESPYARISCAGIGAPFSKGDGVRFSGLPAVADAVYVLQACERDAVVIRGVLLEAERADTLTLSREMPLLDFVTEAGNRLWGCRYGMGADGEIVNEIYASALGDFRNWQVFEGSAADAFRVGVGTDGAFTGAVTFGGAPIFFKEHHMHRVSGGYPANFQVVTYACEGVKQGSDESIVDLGDALLYHADGGIYLYDGSLPVCVSEALGDVRYAHAAAGALQRCCYVSMQDCASGAWHLFTYDVSRGIWHREDNTRARAFCRVGGTLYFIDGTGRILTTQRGSLPPAEERVPFYAETGVIGADTPESRYLSRLHLRFSLARGARVCVSVQYDSTGDFHEVYTAKGVGTRGVTALLRPRRCDHLRLRIEGEGEVRLLSVTTFTERGSDYDA